MDRRQYPQYPQQPGGPCPPYVQQPGMEYPPYPPYGGQGSAAPPYGGSVYGQGGGPVPPRAPQYVYQTPGRKPPRRRRNRAPLVAVLLCLGLAATVFLGHCNFRCPFCQNSSLVLHPSEEPEISEEEVLRFLKKRTGILEGVCISGGEPTLSADLEDFIVKIREMGYPVKLDTNGTQPEVLKDLAEKDLIQMAAVDIKACPENYPSLTGLLKPDLDAVKETVDFLLHGKLDYEFRTTVVRELHSEEDFHKIGVWLKGAKAYYLQAYRDSDEVLQPGFSSYSLEELEHFREILLENISRVEIRGID